MRTVVHNERDPIALNRLLTELETYEEAALIMGLSNSAQFTTVIYYGRYTNVI
jgi:hypothetical protein